ncbi:MAG: GNAT family N-acetyltransferase [Candidatus Lokiarchaeota archaeon]
MEDYSVVLKIWKETSITITSSESKEEVERMLLRNPNLCLIGKLEDKIIAVVFGGFDGRRGYVHHLAVIPEYQGKGYGRKIMEELVKRFRDMKVHKLHLFVEKRNQDVINFYENLGWEVRNDLEMMSFVPDKDLYIINRI